MQSGQATHLHIVHRFPSDSQIGPGGSSGEKGNLRDSCHLGVMEWLLWASAFQFLQTPSHKGVQCLSSQAGHRPGQTTVMTG